MTPTDLEALRERVRVKPLEWEIFGSGLWVSASSDYFIGCDSVGKHWVHHRISGDLRGHDGRIAFFPVEEAARAAAQADFETRILSALMVAQ